VHICNSCCDSYGQQSQVFFAKLEGLLIVPIPALAKIFHSLQYTHLTFPKFCLNPKTQKFHLTLKSQKFYQFHPQNLCSLNLLTLNRSPPKPSISIDAQLTHSIGVMSGSVLNHGVMSGSVLNHGQLTQSVLNSLTQLVLQNNDGSYLTTDDGAKIGTGHAV
jgi:hypothetical protein